MGDDFDDDYVPDAELELEAQSERAAQTVEAPVSKKRKRTDGDEGAAVGAAGTATTSKRQQKLAQKRKKNPVGDDESAPSTSIAQLPLDAQADRLAQAQRSALPKLSALELEEGRIRESYLADASSVAERASLLEMFKTGHPELERSLRLPAGGPGRPRVLVVTCAALRAADLCRDLKPLQTKKGLIAKLFAKHIKVAEQVKLLKKSECLVAVGTPARLGQLMDSEALSLETCAFLVLDVTHLDGKKRNVLDVQETRHDLWAKVLGHSRAKERLKEGKLKLLLF